MKASSNRWRIIRGIVVAAVVACFGLGITGTASAQAAARPSDCAGRGVPVSKISIQLWTFAEYVGFGTDPATIARLEEVLSRLSEMGYRNVEPFTLSGLSAEDYRALLDKYGLKASARHVNVGTPENPADIEAILEENRILGIKYFGSGSTPIFPLVYTTEAQWIAYAEYLNEVGEQARRAGQTLMVHNHDIEFEVMFGDQTVFDILVAYTDPKNVVFQLDLYWATNGGGIDNPLDVIERYGKRIQLFHVKDMAAGPFPGRIEIVGEGIIDFPEIFAAYSGAGAVLRRRARPALRRPDIRPVRGRPEGLRLPQLRQLLSHSRGGVAVEPRRTFGEHTPQISISCSLATTPITSGTSPRSMRSLYASARASSPVRSISTVLTPMTSCHIRHVLIPQPFTGRLSPPADANTLSTTSCILLHQLRRPVR